MEKTTDNVPRFTEEQLAARAKNGDRAAFEALVIHHHGRVYAFHRSSGNTRENAEDYTQETFMRAFKSICRYDTSRPFLPWLYTIARREAIRSWKRHKPTEPLPPHEDAVSADSDPHLAPHLWHLARLHLKPAAFTAIWLHYREEIPLRDIARSIGKSESATKVLLHRARATLRKHLDPADFAQDIKLNPLTT